MPNCFQACACARRCTRCRRRARACTAASRTCTRRSDTDGPRTCAAVGTYQQSPTGTHKVAWWYKAEIECPKVWPVCCLKLGRVALMPSQLIPTEACPMQA
eukprot:5679967-Pleurochrysis_carterae.AAC.1